MKTKHDIYKEVCNVLVNQLGISEDQILPCSHIINDLGADSLDCAEIIMALEEKFDISIPDEDFDESDENANDESDTNTHDKLTVEKFSDYICNKLGIH